MKKKGVVIGIIIIVVIIAIGSIVYINMNNDSIDLSVVDEITLNDGEKEILEALKQADNYLRNPVPKEENANSLEFTVSVTDPTDFKTMFSKVYECRKYTSENGDVSYLFDVEMNSDTEEFSTRRYIDVNDHGVTIFFKLEDLDTLNLENESKYEDGTYTLGKEFYKTIFEGVENQVNKVWQESATYQNVDYDKLYNKI